MATAIHQNSTSVAALQAQVAELKKQSFKNITETIKDQVDTLGRLFIKINPEELEKQLTKSPLQEGESVNPNLEKLLEHRKIQFQREGILPKTYVKLIACSAISGILLSNVVRGNNTVNKCVVASLLPLTALLLTPVIVGFRKTEEFLETVESTPKKAVVYLGTKAGQLNAHIKTNSEAYTVAGGVLTGVCATLAIAFSIKAKTQTK